MKKSERKLLQNPILNWVLKLMLFLIVIAMGVYIWARSATDTNLIARGIMWGDSDFGDIYRFPSREMRASTDPIEFGRPDASLQDILDDIPITNDDINVVNMPFDEYLEYTNTTAFIVLNGDQMVYEDYFNDADRESIQTSFSAAKSFTSTLIGIAIEEGFIESLDDSITDYLPELSARDKRFESITLRHLITMTSGLRWERSDSNPMSDDFITYYSPDLRKVALEETEIINQPGTEYLYNDFNPLLLGLVIERASGMSVSEYMETRLWQPMGAAGNGFWSLDSEQSGFEKMFVGLNGRAIDLIKLGWLFLNEGKKGDSQIISSAWVKEATRDDTTTDPSSFYQYYWFIDEERHMYFAEGDKCQFIFVYPQANLVAARFGKDCGGTGFSDFVPNVLLWFESQLEKQ
jgi:CubicO group peptidase (beta-lactamase class C family)